jgi:hypothetical protein
LGTLDGATYLYAKGRARRRRSRHEGRHLRKRRKVLGGRRALRRRLAAAKAGTAVPVRVYHSIGKSSFDQDPVRYDVFFRVLEELVGHLKGRPAPLSLLRPRPDAKSLSTSGCFGGPGVKCSSTFAVVDAVKLRELEEVAARPEAGGRPASSLRQHHLGRTLSYGSIRIVEYKCTPETERFEADIRELNEFLARFTLTGGTHYGYTRVFNNRSWRAGGRVWSAGEYSYQQMRETERLKMTINGEPVAEIDIKASQLTIYPAMIGDLDATEL